LLATVGDEDHQIHIWNTRTHHHLHSFESQQNAVKSLAWSANGRLLAAGSIEGTIYLWQTSNGQLHRVYQGLRGKPVSLAFDRERQRLGAASSKGEVRVWLIDDARHKPDEQSEIVAKAFAFDGRVLLAESQEERIALWQLAPAVTTYQITAANMQLLSVSFRADASLLVAGYGSGRTQVWRLEQIDE